MGMEKKKKKKSSQKVKKNIKRRKGRRKAESGICRVFSKSRNTADIKESPDFLFIEQWRGTAQDRSSMPK